MSRPSSSPSWKMATTTSRYYDRILFDFVDRFRFVLRFVAISSDLESKNDDRFWIREGMGKEGELRITGNLINGVE